MAGKYKVLRDTREKLSWDFAKSDKCDGTFDVALETGDYTLEGYEKDFIIERKGSTAEIAHNLFEPRFYRELERLESFQYAFIVCEFSLPDVFIYPEGSGIPRFKWKHLRVSSELLMAKLVAAQLKYRASWVFAGEIAKQYCEKLFKRVVECPSLQK